MNYGTYTSTYTVVDIRKTFEAFEADLRMIARRTGKWTPEFVEKVSTDVIKLAEAKYLSSASIALLNSYGTPLRAAKYTVNENGTAISGDRAGGNDWPDQPNTSLTIILSYSTRWGQLTPNQRQEFENQNLRLTWSPTSVDTNFPLLSRQASQVYGSNGYELKKENYK
jgi:hypothetical protein